MKNIKNKVKNLLKKIRGESATNFSLLASTLSQSELLKQIGELANSGKTTLYDKALDSEYLKTHIGGANHRLFDGGHDLLSAWQKVKDASPDDTLTQEVIGYVSALWKDGTTLKGLPFLSLDKQSYDEWANKLINYLPIIDKKYLYNLSTFNVLEVLSSTLGVVSIIFAFKKEDQKKLAEILGSMGITSILTANTLMGIAVIVSSAYAYYIKNAEINKKSIGTGAVLTTSSLALFSVLEFPLIINIVIVASLTTLLKQQVLESDKLEEFIKEKIFSNVSNLSAESLEKVKELVQKAQEKIAS